MDNKTLIKTILYIDAFIMSCVLYFVFFKDAGIGWIIFTYIVMHIAFPKRLLGNSENSEGQKRCVGE